MQSSPVNPGDVLAGKYQVEEILGEGGMGVVVSAWHIELEERVAIKFLLAAGQGNAGAAERFRREARAAVKIKSEHVARVTDVGSMPDGTSYMVMEFLRGNDLAEELRRRRLPYEEVLEYVLQACEAIAEAHAQGIVHRDLKPANLYLSTRLDGSRSVKVLDFGISKMTAPGAGLGLTRTTAIIGSPLYMSPEQMDSPKSVDERTDIWALGVILYELMCGTTPFYAETMPRLAAALIHEEPVPLIDRIGDVPQGVNDVVMQCLRKDREERFASVGELAQALAAHGSPQSQLSAERAVRVLSRSQPDLAGAPPPTPVATESIEEFANSQTQVSYNDEISRPAGGSINRPHTAAALASGTVASWGKTGDSKDEPQPPQKRSNMLLMIGGGLALAAVAAGAFFLGASNRDKPAAAAAKPPPAVSKAAEPKKSPAPVESKAEPEKAAKPKPAASASAAPEASAKAPDVPTKKAPPVHVRPKTPKPQPTKTANPGGLTDFGGR